MMANDDPRGTAAASAMPGVLSAAAIGAEPAPMSIPDLAKFTNDA